MTSHKRLAERVRKAKSAKVAEVEPHKVEVEGSKLGYTVTVKRAGSTMTVECKDETGAFCKGNYHTVCYHSMRAAWSLATARGYHLSFCVSEEHATRLSRIGGRVIRIKNGSGKSSLWMVATKVDTSDYRLAVLESIEENILEQEAKLEANAWSLKAQKGLDGLVAGRAKWLLELAQ
jgi:hypothetical protein